MVRLLALVLIAVTVPSFAQNASNDPQAEARVAFVAKMNDVFAQVNKNGAHAALTGTVLEVHSPVADQAHFDAVLSPAFKDSLAAAYFSEFIYTNDADKTFTYAVPRASLYASGPPSAPSSNTAGRLNLEQVQTYAALPIKKTHSAHLVDQQAFFATSDVNTAQLAEMFLFMPDAWIATRAQAARQQFTAFKPTDSDYLIECFDGSRLWGCLWNNSGSGL
jgi:hypothetical protein